MSAPDDLEGDDIWGDATSGSGNNNAATVTETTSDESKQQENDENTNSNILESLEDEETRHMTISELRQRIHLLSNDIRVMKSDVQRINHESRGQRERIRENLEKVKVNKQLPYLVANVVEILEPDAEDGTKRENITLFCVSRCKASLVVSYRYDSDYKLRILLGNLSNICYRTFAYQFPAKI
jgi:ATP-dependent 26S proteasome regulatory subunit